MTSAHLTRAGIPADTHTLPAQQTFAPTRTHFTHP